MGRARRALAVAAVALLVVTGALVAMPWSHDMEDQISIKPQELPIPPPELSVPTTGREFPAPRAVAEKLVNPVPADSASVARGDALFHTVCTPCHGQHGEGLGTVVRRGFMPPPQLTSAMVRMHPDGFIYSYLREGGLIAMPTYQFALRPHDAWDVVNYVRRLQAEHPTP